LGEVLSVTDEPMQRAVFFDLGGVIVREDDALYDEFGVAHGLEPGEFYRVMYESTAGKALRLGRISREVWFEAVVEMLRDHWGRATEQTLRDWWNRPPQLHGPVLELAAELQKAGVRIGILSNASGDLAERLVSQFGVELEWDVVLASGAVGLAKPDARVYALASERIGVPMERCFFVDDLQENVEGAVAAGMAAYLFEGDYEALRVALGTAGLPVVAG
jgi:putative hydrolase of the HAD superfamily